MKWRKQNDTRNHTMGAAYNLNTKILCSIKPQTITKKIKNYENSNRTKNRISERGGS